MAPIIAALLQQGLTLFAGAVASKGADYVKEKTGVDLASALGSESGRLELKKLEVEHEQFLIDAAAKAEELDYKYFASEVTDKDSARKREIDVEENRGAPWWAPSTLTVLTFLVVVGGGWMFYTVSETDTRYALIAVITMVLQYYYGTTKSSAANGAALRNLMAKETK